MTSAIALLTRRLLDGGWLRMGVLAIVLAMILPGGGLGPAPPRPSFSGHAGLGLPDPSAPRIRLEVAGRSYWVPLGATLGDVVRDLDLRPRAGNLLAMDGSTLHQGAYPGGVLLDGHASTGSTPLGAGARITLRPGRSRVEPLRRTVLEFPQSGPHDPQLSLATGAGRQVLTSGVLSHKARLSAFLPTGPQRVPNAVALTFDDGPWPGSTAQILAVLERQRVHATFFLVGEQVRRHPELLRQEVAAGMTIGTHSLSHPQPFGDLSDEAVRQEIEGGLAALADNGVRTRLFRPPGGAIPPGVLAAARHNGLRTVLWSVDPIDWRRGTTPDQIVQRVLAETKPGSIVLLHDGGGDRSATVAALPAIIKALKQRKLDLVTL